MSLSIRPVTTRADLDTFVRLPARLYRDDPRYIPPLVRDRRAFLDPLRSAFFRHGEAQYFLAERNGRPVGRISAQIDRAAPKTTFDGIGFYGCLDAEDDAEVVSELLRTAEAWLGEKGMTTARGPCLLSMNGEAGLLVEGQDEPPMLMVPWHPEYLGPLIESSSHTKVRDLYYYRIDSHSDHLDRVTKRLGLARRRGALAVRRLDRRHAAREMELIRSVYNDAWQHNWGFIPLMPEDLEAFRRDLRLFLEPDGAIVVECEGEPAGVVLVLPNIAEMTRDLGTDPGPIGWTKLLLRALRKSYTTARIILFGVNDRFSGSMLGVTVAMTLLDEMVASARRHRLDSVEAGWVLENNSALIGIMEQFGARRVRTLRLYEHAIERHRRRAGMAANGKPDQ